DAALQEAPEVLQPVGVNLPINILLGVVNNPVGVFLSQSIVRAQRIGVESCASFDIRFHAIMQCAALPVCDYYGTNLSATFQRAKHDSFIFAASTSDATFALIQMHV